MGAVVSVWHWFLYVTGSDDTSGNWYGFWSGFGSDLGEFAIIAGLIGVYRRHNCGEDGCWRLGRHEVTDLTTGQKHIKCRRHIARHLP